MVQAKEKSVPPGWSLVAQLLQARCWRLEESRHCPKRIISLTTRNLLPERRGSLDHGGPELILLVDELLCKNPCSLRSSLQILAFRLSLFSILQSVIYFFCRRMLKHSYPPEAKTILWRRKFCLGLGLDFENFGTLKNLECDLIHFFSFCYDILCYSTIHHVMVSDKTSPSDGGLPNSGNSVILCENVFFNISIPSTVQKRGLSPPVMQR